MDPRFDELKLALAGIEWLPAMAPGDTDAIEALQPWRVAERPTQASDSKDPETATPA